MTTWTALAEHSPDVRLDGPDARVILAVVLEYELAPTAPIGQASRLGAAALAGTASASIFLLITPGGRPPADFLTYRYAAALAARGGDVYAANLSGPGLAGQPFTYPPVATLVLWPVTTLPSRTGYVAWTALTLAVLAAVLSIGTTGTARRSIALTGAVLAASTTDLLGDHLRVGQIDVLLMGLCLLDLTRSDRSAFGRRCPRGVLVGVATAIKLTPALFVVHFAVTRQWRLATFAAAGCAAATGVGALVHPHLTATFARSVAWTLSDRVDLQHAPSYSGNQSVTGIVAAAGFGSGPASLLLVLAVGAATLGAARSVHRAGRERDAWLIIGMSAPLLTPFSWNHHYVFVLPALAVLARRSWAARPAATALGLAGALALLHFGPAAGAATLRDDPWWAAPAGAVVRENAVLAAVAGIVALTWSARRAAVR